MQKHLKKLFLSWKQFGGVGFSKKHNRVFITTLEAKYVAAGSSCTQLLWMKQMMKEYDVFKNTMTLYCGNDHNQ